MKKISLLKYFLLISNLGAAQYQMNDFSLADTTTKWLDQRLALVNTEIYIASKPKIEKYSWNSSPMLLIEGGREGSLSYRSEQFFDIRMLYDAYEGQLLAELLINDEYYKIVRLNQDQVEWFRIGTYYFKRYNESVFNRPEGFYAIAFEGDAIEILVKKEKKKRIERGTFIFFNDDKVLFKIDKQYHRIDNRRSVYKLVPIHKSELKEYFKSRNIRQFSKVDIRKLSDFGRFCNQLIIGK